jgi:UPF0716 protein FxsA
VVALLAVLFVVVPFVELTLIVWVAGQVGGWATLALLLLVSAAGAVLMKQQGGGVLRRMQAQIGRGEIPTTGILDGVLILFAGALMLTPGFLTDVLGLVLLIPPTRALVRSVLVRRYEKRVRAAFTPVGASWGGPFGTGFARARVFTGSAGYDRRGAGVIDVDEVDGVDDASGGRTELREP